MKRTALYKLLALAIGLVGSLGLMGAFELKLRGEERAYGLAFPADQPGRKFSLDPVNVGSDGVLNSLGFNDREFVEQGSEGSYRVALFGDSVSFGSGIRRDEVYPIVAQGMLQESGQKVEIYNFSMYGYDVEQIAATLHYVGWRFRPDLVVYAWFTNDHIASELVYRGQKQDPVFIGTTVPEGLSPLSEGATLWLAARSAAVRRYLGAKAARQRDETRTNKGKGGQRPGDDAFFERHLDALLADARSHGTPVLVYGLVPHVLADSDPQTCGKPDRDARFCADQMSQLNALQQLLFERQVPFQSALPWYQSGDEKAYFRPGAPTDMHHPGPAGHVLLAWGLQDAIVRLRADETLVSPPQPMPEAFARHLRSGGGKRRRRAPATRGRPGPLGPRCPVPGGRRRASLTSQLPTPPASMRSGVGAWLGLTKPGRSSPLQRFPLHADVPHLLPLHWQPPCVVLQVVLKSCAISATRSPCPGATPHHGRSPPHPQRARPHPPAPGPGLHERPQHRPVRPAHDDRHADGLGGATAHATRRPKLSARP